MLGAVCRHDHSLKIISPCLSLKGSTSWTVFGVPSLRLPVSLGLNGHLPRSALIG